eukprot:XP_765277.1 hypothetical protein [Theileria parva strain Muguga]
MDNLYDIFTTLSTELTGYNVKLIQNVISVNIPQMGADIKMARQNTMKKLKNLESGLSQDMVFKQKVF